MRKIKVHSYRVQLEEKARKDYITLMEKSGWERLNLLNKVDKVYLAKDSQHALEEFMKDLPDVVLKRITIADIAILRG
jgi:hypothetical protein